MRRHISRYTLLIRRRCGLYCREEIESQIREYSSRGDVTEERVRLYVDTFSESELEELVALVKLPGYKLLLRKQFEVSNPFFVSLIKFKLVPGKSSGVRN